MPDYMDIEILDDGTISVKTSNISEANHTTAADFMLELQQTAGGKRETKKRRHPFMRNVKVLKGGKIIRKA